MATDKKIDSIYTSDKFGSSLSLNYDGSIILIGAWHRGSGQNLIMLMEKQLYINIKKRGIRK